MPRNSRNPRIPKYRLHKSTGQGIVTLAGHDHYLGTFGSAESRQRYEQLIAEWLAGGRTPMVERAPDLTVSEVLAAYWAHAEPYYAAPDGSATTQQDRVRYCLAVARKLYGPEPASRFGPLALKACRAKMVESGLCRRVVNQRTDCLKRAFKWAAGEELVAIEVYQALRAVEGLRKGRTQAPDHQEVKPVPPDHIEPVLAELPPFLADVARLQLLTAARPGEVLDLQPGSFDRTGSVWKCRPDQHKTNWRGHRRTLFFGPRAQELVRRYLPGKCSVCGKEGRIGRADFWSPHCPGCSSPLELDCPGRYLFCPREADLERKVVMRAARKSKVQPSQKDRSKKRRDKSPGVRYQPRSYSAAVRRACDKAKLPRWHPHQLRHNACTLIVEQFGWDVARIILGHRTLDTTRIYGEDDIKKAIEAIARLG